MLYFTSNVWEVFVMCPLNGASMFKKRTKQTNIRWRLLWLLWWWLSSKFGRKPRLTVWFPLLHCEIHTVLLNASSIWWCLYVALVHHIWLVIVHRLILKLHHSCVSKPQYRSLVTSRIPPWLPYWRSHKEILKQHTWSTCSGDTSAIWLHWS